jgi:hypothetical protein
MSALARLAMNRSRELCSAAMKSERLMGNIRGGGRRRYGAPSWGKHESSRLTLIVSAGF